MPELYIPQWREKLSAHRLTLKRFGVVKLIPPPCGFPNTVFCREELKPLFCVTFNMIIRYIFPKNFIEIPQIVRRYEH